MAVTVTTGVLTGHALIKQATVIAASDANTTATIAHGLGVTPEQVQITPLSNKGVLSRWFHASSNTTSVVLTKSTATGSGGATAQIKVTMRKFHSLV